MNQGAARVLVVEDDEILAQVLQFNLEAAGFQVTLVHDGLVAWQTLEQGDFDLLLTDVQMPGMDGIQLCTQLRAEPRYADTPIVLVTAKGFEIDVPRIQRELRVSHVFTKPFGAREIVEALHKCLEQEEP